MNTSLLLLGDSIGKGLIYNENKQRYTISTRSFATRLKEFFTMDVHARVGATLQYGEKELGALDLNGIDASAVCIEFGGNDSDFDWQAIAQDPKKDHRPKTELADFEKRLRTLVQRVQQAGKKPVLMTLPPLNAPAYFDWFTKGDAAMGQRVLQWLGDISRIYWWHERYSLAVRRVTEKTGALLADVRSAFLSMEDYRSLLCIDGIHPNEAGHALIADTFAQALV